jgi:PIN domain nuclease of toxin-antitoxin system
MARPPSVNVLLDTCALLALARGDLPKEAVGALRTAPEANVSSVTAWEVALKVASGKLRLSQPPEQWFEGMIARYQLREITFDFTIACAAAALPVIHKDPFDRVLVALARKLSLQIITSDQAIPTYPSVSTVWD